MLVNRKMGLSGFARDYNVSVLQQYGICGGWVVSDNDLRLVDAVTGHLQIAIGSNPRWQAVVSKYGISAEYADPGITRSLASLTGQPSSQSFTFLARVRYNDATASSAGVIARTDATALSATGGGNTLPLWRNGSTFDMRVNGTDYTGAGTWNLGQWYDVEIVGSSVGCSLYVDGVDTISGAAAALGTIEKWLHYGDVAGGGLNAGDFQIMYSLFCNRPLTPRERQEIREDPHRLLVPTPIVVPHYFATGQRIHYVVYPASETRYPQAKDVIDGWPGVATTTGYEANSQSELVNFYVEAEGLLDNTSYKIAYVWYDGVNVSDVVVSGSFTTLSGAISLTADSDTQVSTSATGVITQIQVLVASNSTQDSTSGTGSIASPINLTVGSDAQNSTSASVVITQNHTISVGSDNQTNSATTNTVSQVHVLVSADSTEDSTSSTGSITQIQVLTVASNTQSSTSASGSVVLNQTLTSGSNTQDSISGTGVIYQTHIVSVGSDVQVSTSATAVITQTHILVASDCSQDSTSSTGTVTSDGALAAAPSSQSSTSNSVSVTQVQILAGSGSSQSNSDNNAVIAQVHIVSVANCTSDSTSGTGIVSVDSGLVGSSCTQSGGNSSASITQTQIIVVDNCNSTNNSSNSDITQVNVITAANCAQADSSEAAALTQIYNTILASICTEDASSSSGSISIEHILFASTPTQDNASLAAAVTLVHQLLAENVSQSNNSSSPSLATSFYVPGTVVAQNEPKRLFISGTRAGVTVTVVNPTRYIRASG